MCSALIDEEKGSFFKGLSPSSFLPSHSPPPFSTDALCATVRFFSSAAAPEPQRCVYPPLSDAARSLSLPSLAPLRFLSLAVSSLSALLWQQWPRTGSPSACCRCLRSASSARRCSRRPRWSLARPSTTAASTPSATAPSTLRVREGKGKKYSSKL